MAAFDRSNGNIVVRVVYDGPSGAGKTENLRQLVQTFTSQRRGELSSPGTWDEHTAYFDWLNFNGGVVSGHALRAQLVTVPGRSVLTRRRWQLVRAADVIVFVCESTNRGLKEAKRWLELLRAQLAASALGPPIIVQANKQDVADAVSPRDLAKALGLPSDAEVVAASAATGAGVRETVVRAIRAAAALAERDVIDKGADGLPDAGDEAELLSALDGSAQLRTVLDLDGRSPPPFPDEDVASGSVWPGTTGRVVLRALARALTCSGIARVAAPSSAFVFRVGELRLETSLTRRFENHPDARSALLEMARERVRLGDAQTTLVLATGDDGATWVWSIAPWTAPAEVTTNDAGWEDVAP